MSKKVMNLDETPSDSGWILDSDEAKLEMQLATQGDEKYVLGSLTEDEKQELAMLLEQCAGKDPDALIDALKQRSARFVLAKRTWRGPIQVRFGPSTKVYSLFVKSDGKVWRLDLQDDPTEEDEIAGTPESGTKVVDTSGDSHDVFDLKKGQTVDLKPGSAMNPTKETPAKLEVLDQGEADVMTEETTARKYKFQGSGLKGVWFFHPEEPDEPQSFWLMTKSGGPETKEM